MTVSSSGGICSSTSTSGTTSGFPSASTMDSLATNYSIIAQEECLIQQAILAASSQCQPGGGQFCTTVGGDTPMTFVSGVGSVTVNNGGANYFQDTPKAVVVPPIGSTGSGAIVSLVTNGGNIIGITVISGGTGYDPVSATLSVTGGNGLALLIPLVNASGQIIGVNIANPGGGYTVIDSITATRAVAPSPGYVNANIVITGVSITGQILNLAILNPGSGYQPSVSTIEIVSTLNPSIVYPIGTGFGANVLTSDSVISTLGPVTGGELYIAGLYLNVPLTGGHGTGATANIVVSPGTIVTLGAPTPGSGYIDGLYSDVPLTGGTGSGATANITVAGGIVTTVILVDGGIGYLTTDVLSASDISLGGTIATLGLFTAGSGYGPGIYFNVPLTGGHGTGATANITVVGGIVTILALVDGGTGYLAGDVLSATGASLGNVLGSGFSVPVATLSGSGFTVPVSAVGGTVTSATLVNYGTSYLVGDILSASNSYLGGFGSGFSVPVATLQSGVITQVVVYNTGYGYATLSPYLVITDPGTGAQTLVTLTTPPGPTSVASIAVTASGTNYDQLATGVVYNPSTAVVPATALATLSGGAFTGIIGLFGGGYYTSPPTVTISGNGTGASATAVISAGKVVGITSIVGGIGYTTATITFTPPANPPNPTPATVTINVPLNIYGTNGNAYYQAWAGTQCNAALSGQLNSVLTYFTTLGYTISLSTNPETGTTLQWNICW